MYRIRVAEPADLPRLVEIYNQAIASHNVTGDTVPFSVEERRRLVRSTSAGLVSDLYLSR